jgi:hypothetical protein
LCSAPTRVAPTANVAAPVACPFVTWALWLAIPVAVTVVAAIATWLRARPARALKTDEAVRAHGDFLDALVQTARSKDRGPLAPPGD